MSVNSNREWREQSQHCDFIFVVSRNASERRDRRDIWQDAINGWLGVATNMLITFLPRRLSICYKVTFSFPASCQRVFIFPSVTGLCSCVTVQSVFAFILGCLTHAQPDSASHKSSSSVLWGGRWQHVKPSFIHNRWCTSDLYGRTLSVLNRWHLTPLLCVGLISLNHQLPWQCVMCLVSRNKIYLIDQ